VIIQERKATLIFPRAKGGSSGVVLLNDSENQS
jgi:hypothetical protein